MSKHLFLRKKIAPLAGFDINNGSASDPDRHVFEEGLRLDPERFGPPDSDEPSTSSRYRLRRLPKGTN